MKNTKTFQGTEERLNGNAGAGLNKVVCVVVVLILIVLVCVGGFFWYKHSKNKELNPLEQSGEKIESGELIEIGLQVGDYVSYAADIDKIADWRVWKIEGDNVIIVPRDPLGNLTLEGPEDWLNAEEKIENECDKYVNSSLGITAEEIRSMKLEDIEEVLPEEYVESVKLNDDYGKEYSYESGIFYAEKADVGTFDGYNEELSTPKTASLNSPVILVNTDLNWYSPTWNNLENTKTEMTNDTYGTILGNSLGWLASRGVFYNSSDADFEVRVVLGGLVSNTRLCSSDGSTFDPSFGVRPLVTLNSKLFNGEGEGTKSNPWQLGEKIESGEIEGTNGVTGENLSGNELVGMGLQVGDYVSYATDIDKIADWRVWRIEGDNVIIVPTESLGNLILEGVEDWLNAEEKIENECDKYVNSSLGITEENIRSMKIEDIEKVMLGEEITEEKEFWDYGIADNYTSGTFYAKEASEAETKFDEYNTALISPQIASLSNSVKLKSTYWLRVGPTWNKLDNTKSGITSDTYGTILGNIYGWLASRCVYSYSGGADFKVRYVCSGNVGATTLYDSDGNTDSGINGVRPLVSLSSKLFTGEGEGTKSNPWKLNG